MRKILLVAAAAFLATAFSAAPASAFSLPGSGALTAASDAVGVTDQVCWGCGPHRRPGYGYRGYGYRGYGERGYGYRPYYRSYARPYYRSYARPYSGYGYARPYRSYGYGAGYGSGYGGYGYSGGYGGGYGYGYQPRHYYYVGSSVYSF